MYIHTFYTHHTIHSYACTQHPVHMYACMHTQTHTMSFQKVP